MMEQLEIIRSKRRTIAIEVKKDLRIVVRVPLEMKAVSYTHLLPTSASLFTITASVPLMCRIAGRSRRPTLSWKQEKA